MTNGVRSLPHSKSVELASSPIEQHSILSIRRINIHVFLCFHDLRAVRLSKIAAGLHSPSRMVDFRSPSMMRHKKDLGKQYRNFICAHQDWNFKEQRPHVDVSV